MVENDQESDTDIFSVNDGGYNVEDKDDRDVYEYDEKDGDDLPSYTADDRQSRGVTSVEDVVRGSTSSHTADVPSTSNFPSTSHQDDDEDTDSYEPEDYPRG